MGGFEGPVRVSTPDMESLGMAELSDYVRTEPGFTARLTFSEGDGSKGVGPGLKLRLRGEADAPVVVVQGTEWADGALSVTSDLPLPGDADYEGATALTMSSGEPFATARLVARTTDGGWTGLLHDIQFRTQMVPVPLSETEQLRLEDAEGRPVLEIRPRDQFKACAVVESDDPLPG